ncbi:MAG: efflux RND transporter periplasmic adaptor subunit, partial [Steroidobacterales bacterium]
RYAVQWLVIAAACLVVCNALPEAAEAADTAATVAATIVLPGQVVAYQSALITAKVAGFLKRIPVDKGDRVKAGALIAEIEVPELLADRLQYKAEVDVASRDYERIRQAAQGAPDLVTPESLDSARGRLEVAQAQLARVETLLNYARITAPFSGTITARYLDPGAFVPVPTTSSQQSGAIVNLMDFSEVRIQIPIPESDASRVRPGCQAVITAPGLPGRRFAGSVTRISYALEPTARTMLAEIDMKNPDDLLQPGMYLSVQLTPNPQAPRQ